MVAATETSDKKILLQLDRILNSKTFHSVERLKRFLSVVVSETLAGRGDQLKEFVVGEQVFEKGGSFDPRNDPIVRVQARRLRARLARYYLEEGQNDEILIELPKGGYAPTFKRREAPLPRRSMTAALASGNSVAVLPFDDLTEKATLNYLCKGICQEVICALTKLEAVRVISADGMRFPKNGNGNGSGREGMGQLNAATIVCGSIRGFGDDLRITTQLIDGASGWVLWSESIDRKSDANPLEIQAHVAGIIQNKVKDGLSERGWRKNAGRQTDNLAAYNLYQQGRYHLNQRTEEGLRKAVGFFEKVIAEDPRYALGYAGLADAYELLGHYGVLAPVEVWTKAPSNAGWAVLQDENSSEAHTSLAHVKSTQDWDWVGAEQEFRRALQLDARNSTAHHWYAMSCLAPVGRLDEALEEMRLAQSLDPISSIIARDLALIHYYRRDMEDALEQCDHTIELNPHFSPAYWALGLIQEQRGDFEEAVAALQRAIQLAPKSPRMKGALGRTLALCGKRKDALSILKELHVLSGDRYVSPFEFASMHFALEQLEPGFEWLKKAFQDRSFELVSIKVDPRFDLLKSNPVFISLSSQLGLQ